LKQEIIPKLEIKKLVYQGYGLGFSNSNPIFVYHAVPGDIVNAKIIYHKKQVSFAVIDQLLQPGENRIDADCEVFGTCGGCEWLNINYKAQLLYKENIVREIFKKFPDSIFSDIAGSTVFKHYRNKSFMPTGMVEGKPAFGIYAKNSHSIIPHQACKLHPGIFDILGEAVLTYLKKANEKVYNELNRSGNLKHIGFRYSFQTDEVLVILVTRTSKLAFTKQLVNLLLKTYPEISGIIQNINPEPVNTILGSRSKLLFGKNWLEDLIGNIKFRINYNSFFQINPFIMKKLYDYVKEEISPHTVVIDAYSGIGSIGLYIADKAEQVIAIEANEAAVKDGLKNRDLNSIVNIQFICGKVEDKIDSVCAQNKVDSIVFDPPRKGLEKAIIEIVCRQRIKKIIYVSCNPATQIRDVELLIENGYSVKSIKPFDMFPNTYHIENVVVLEL